MSRPRRCIADLLLDDSANAAVQWVVDAEDLISHVFPDQIACQEIINARPYAFLDDAPFEGRRTNAIRNRSWADPAETADLSLLNAGAIKRVKAEAWAGFLRIHRYSIDAHRKNIKPVSLQTYTEFLFDRHQLLPLIRAGNKSALTAKSLKLGGGG